jgi:FkbM family methyltransferase
VERLAKRFEFEGRLLTQIQIQQPWGYYAPRGLTALSFSLQSKILSRRMNKRLIRWKLLPSVYDVSRFGVKLRCRAADNFTERTILFSQTSKQEMGHLLGGLEAGDTFIDIGANCGIFSLTASRIVGAGGRVVAIEPNPAMVERLRFNIEANAFDNVTIVEAAVGESIGEATFHLFERQLGRSRLARKGPGRTITVSVKPLADICAELAITRLGAIKIDVEGYEDRALLPFFRSAPKSLWPRVILMEISSSHAWREDCLRQLQEMGFHIKWQSKRDALLTLDEPKAAVG